MKRLSLMAVMLLSFERLESRLALAHGDALLVTGFDAIPNPVQEPDTVSVADGSWFAPATWSRGVPTAEMDALVVHRVTIDSQPLSADFNHDGQVRNSVFDVETGAIGLREPELVTLENNTIL